MLLSYGWPKFSLRGQIIPFEELLNFCPKLCFLSHNFGSSYASKPIKDFKDADYSLVSKKSWAKNGSQGWRSGPGILGEKGENMYRHPQRTPNPNENLLQVQADFKCLCSHFSCLLATKDSMSLKLINQFSVCLRFSSRVAIVATPCLRTGVVKLRSAGHNRSADQLNPARQIPCTFFSSTTFPSVYSSATASAAARLLLTCLPQQHFVASSAIKCTQNLVTLLSWLY